MFKPRTRKGRRLPTNESPENDDETDATRRDPFYPELVSMFLNLQEKLNSPVFNGGFDKLLMKVDAIETSQKHTSELISTINKTIYEPDDGLFQRIKNVEKLNSDKLTELAVTQKGLATDLGELKDSIKDNMTLAANVKDLSKEVDDLKEWKSGISKKLWIFIPIFLTGMVKVGWDWIGQHIFFK